MKAWNEIAGDFEQDKREPKVGEYSIVAAGGVGRIACYRPGLVLMDFYRTTPLLVKDLPVRGAESSASVHQETGDRTGGATPPTAATPKSQMEVSIP